MTGYFLTGFIAGISLSLIFIAGKLFKYRRETELAKENVERLERLSCDLQYKLKRGDQRQIPTSIAPADKSYRYSQISEN